MRFYNVIRVYMLKLKSYFILGVKLKTLPYRVSYFYNSSKIIILRIIGGLSIIFYLTGYNNYFGEMISILFLI
jgi:hypothetical protein